MAGKLCILGLLIFNTFTDLKCRKILIMPCLLLALAGALHTLIPNNFTTAAWLTLLAGVCPGILLLVCSLVWKEEVGAGDGLTLLAAGAWMGPGPTVDLLLTGLLLAACFCLTLIIFRRAGRKTQIPFMPFLLAGQIVLMAI